MQRVAERVSAIITSGPFVILNTGFFLIWILVNTLRHPTKINWHDDPPTFFTLGFLITLEAIILSMFVLNSQKRQAKRDAIKADLDYQINRKAHLEITQLHEKLDRLEGMIAGLAGAAGREGSRPGAPTRQRRARCPSAPAWTEKPAPSPRP